MILGKVMIEDHANRKNVAWDVWMAAAQNGDRRAYRRLLLGITPYIRAIAARLLANPSEIEDAIQDVLIAVHEARASYDPTRAFRPWLAGIARHRIIDRTRAMRRRALHEIPLTEEHDRAAPTDTLRDHDLEGAIAQLTVTEKLAIQRLKLEEHSLRAVATETGISVGALKVATHRALRRLRGLLTREEPA